MTTILRGSSSTTPRRLLSNTCTGRRTIPTRVVSCRPVVWHGNRHPHHHLEYHQQQQHQQHQFRYGSSSSSVVYTSGQGWTGALGQGTTGMLTPDMSDVTEEERDNLFRTVRIEDMEMEVESSSGTTTINSRVVGGAAGWGHTALIITKSSSESSSSPVVKTSQLLISGRPYDFQALLRLNRIPSFLRRAVIARSLKYDSNDPETSETSLIGKAIDFFFTHHDYRQDDQPQPSSYRYGIVPSFTEIALPGGDVPAIPEQPSSSTTPSSSSSSSSSSRSTTLLHLAYDRNTKVAASAGLTAIIGQSGTLYTFGINLRGQCGTGQPTVNHVWEPTPLRIEPYSTTDDDEDDTTIVSVALGLQHGVALSNKGTLYAWGKGTRGQLGILLPDPNEQQQQQQQQQQQFETEYSYDKDAYKTEERPTGNVVAEFAASRVTEFHLPGGDEGSLSKEEGERVRCIGAGFNHSAAVTESNHAWIWGKNTSVQPPPSPTPTTSTNQSNQQPQPSIQHQYTKDDLLDTHSPTLIQGLPLNMPILDISCGSHHTSILLGDGSIYAVGVPTDTTEVRRDGGRPIVDRAVEIVPKGIVEWPVLQFESHFDRTTVVFGDTSGGGDGGGERRVVEVQLWSTEELRGEAVFEPVWVEDLMRKEGRDVEMVHRGWLHTVIVAKDRLEECK